jgi:acetyl-CoA carboxylase biotin carboxyl carrier protein
MSGAADRAALEAMAAIVREYDLDALTVRVGDATYELVVRPEAAPAPAAPLSVPATAAAPVEMPPARPAPGPDAKRILAPIIGVFYNAPAPGAEPFVNVGDRVVVGQVLCILEAMKTMNHILSDYAGVVRRILPENGSLVSLGEEMFWIEP